MRAWVRRGQAGETSLANGQSLHGLADSCGSDRRFLPGETWVAAACSGRAPAVSGLRTPRRRGAWGKLDRARARLYRGQILQENMRLKALVEIYTMHSFAQLCNLKILPKISLNFAKFGNISNIFENVRNFLTKF